MLDHLTTLQALTPLVFVVLGLIGARKVHEWETRGQRTRLHEAESQNEKIEKPF